MKRKIY